MQNPIILTLILLFIINAGAQPAPTEIVILGSDHLAQVYKAGNPMTDILNPKRQQEMESFIKLLSDYKPDIVMVEELPQEQLKIDSLYRMYMQGKLPLDKLEKGRSETYQVAFKIAAANKLQRIYCVNAPGVTSQSMLDNGKNIELYNNTTTELRKVVGEKYSGIANGSLSFKDYYFFLNQPSTYKMIYNLRYIVPLRVTEGTFTKPDDRVNVGFIDSKYIGAELTSIFKNRDYKIYSNIATLQMKEKPKRMLLIIGVAHIGSLRSIFIDDPAFKFTEVIEYLK